jgi:hypothetical protein
MIGWLITAGIIGAAIGSRNSKTEVTYKTNYDYGRYTPDHHKICMNCRRTNTAIYVSGRTNNSVTLKFECRNCGRAWGKHYHY